MNILLTLYRMSKLRLRKDFGVHAVTEWSGCHFICKGKKKRKKIIRTWV